jgi:hypothetical protein
MPSASLDAVSGPCSAQVQYTADGPLVPCGLPGPAMRRICLHEHVADVFCCLRHQALMEIGYCITCREIDGHQCPIELAAAGLAPLAPLSGTRR